MIKKAKKDNTHSLDSNRKHKPNMELTVTKLRLNEAGVNPFLFHCLKRKVHGTGLVFKDFLFMSP